MAVAFALAALVAAAHHRVLLFGETFVLRDALTFLAPARAELAGALRSGRFPEWWDGVGFGHPFAAHPAYLATNPVGWLLALLPEGPGADLGTVLLVFLAGAGAAAFASRLGAGPSGALVAGASLALGGYLSSILVNGFAPFVAWTPWVAWGTARLADKSSREASPAKRLREALPLAAALSFQLAAGEPASILVALLLGLSVLLAQSRPLRTAAVPTVVAGVFAAALAGVSLLPAVLFYPESARAAGLASESARWSMHPARALEWIWPLAFGSVARDGWFAGFALEGRGGDPFWSFSLFVGFPVLLLAVLGARARPRALLLAGSGLFVLLALGSHGPLYRLLLSGLVESGRINFPEKFLYGALVVWSALAGVGWTTVFGDRPSRRVAATAAAGAALLLAALGLFVTARLPLERELARRGAAAALRLGDGLDAARDGAIVAAMGGLAFAAGLAWRRNGRARRGAELLAAVGVLAPLLLVQREITPLVARAEVERMPRALAALPPPAQEGPPSRLLELPSFPPLPPFRSGREMALRVHEGLEGNVAARFGFGIVPGFESAELAASRQFWLEAGRQLPVPALVRFLGVDFVFERVAPLRGDEHLPRMRVASGAGFAGAEVRPRAFVSSRWLAVESADAAFRSLLEPGRDADLGLVSVVGGEASRREGPGPLEPCAVERRRSEEIVLRCTSERGGYAVLLEATAPGWSARLNGARAAVRRVEGLFRGVRIPPGSHEVVFRYRTPGLRAGAAISLAAWLAWGAVLAATRRRRS
jgi:hypothetical protein